MLALRSQQEGQRPFSIPLTMHSSGGSVGLSSFARRTLGAGAGLPEPSSRPQGFSGLLPAPAPVSLAGCFLILPRPPAFLSQVGRGGAAHVHQRGPNHTPCESPLSPSPGQGGIGRGARLCRAWGLLGTVSTLLWVFGSGRGGAMCGAGPASSLRAGGRVGETETGHQPWLFCPWL